MTEPKPLSPREARGLYLDDRETDVSNATLRSHKSRLGHFIDWCREEDITLMNELDGLDLHRYKIWRKEDINKVTLKTQLDTLRVFLRWCEGIGIVEEDLHTSVVSPSLDKGDNQREEMVDSDTAEAILTDLRKYDYASLKSVYAELLWHCALRVGAARALDVEDYDRDDQSLHVVHRPDKGTPIKNKHDGERYVSLSDEVCKVLNDWVDDQRPDVEDEHGRTPLLATSQGRAHIETLRKYSYQLTRPCTYSGECPHGQDIDECDGMDYGTPYECPDAKSPHCWRRGSITHHLREDVPKVVVSDRVNCSPEVIDIHYNELTEKEKMDQRRDYLSNI